MGAAGPLITFIGGGCEGGGGRERRERIRPCSKWSLHAFTFTLRLSFSYLRSAATASFDIKRSSTGTVQMECNCAVELLFELHS
jgi:hypothetical protein